MLPRPKRRESIRDWRPLPIHAVPLHSQMPPILASVWGTTLLLWLGVRSQSVQPRASCREHQLSGEAHSREAVLPLRSQFSGSIFWLECRFPPTGPQSARLSVQTVVHNALEGQWLEQRDWRRRVPIHVQQQVGEREMLRWLVAESEECSQQLRVRWPPLGRANGSEGAENSFSVETLGGRLVSFRRNTSNPGPFDELLSVPSAPVVRLMPPLPADVALSLGPLLCRQLLIPRPECHFELRSDSEKVRLRVDTLRKKWPKGTLKFSFRTGKPNGRLLELGGEAGQTGVDLVDGYLLLANHIVHPSRLLADGNWHSLGMDLHSLSIRVDGQGTAISPIDHSLPSAPIEWMDILLAGEVAAIRMEGADVESAWICRAEEDLLDVRQSFAHQHIFALPSVCAGDRSFCSCKGPNSALLSSMAIGRHTAECPVSVDAAHAFHLARLSDRLAFFIVPNFGPRIPISVLFRSEADTGLVLFGVYSSPNAKGELGGRVQVHFVAKTIFGAFCSSLPDGSERCYSCSIVRDTSLSSSRWVRVSLFHQHNFQFLSVNRQVCLLSPNTNAVDPAEMYRITTTNVLLIGGTFYSKQGARLGQRVSDTFRREFQDNTREKAPSLQGCIGDIWVRGLRQDMEELLKRQTERAARRGEEAAAEGAEIFSVRRGCAQECPAKCNGAPCSRIAVDQWECNCAAIYAPVESANGGCRAEGEGQVLMVGERGSGGRRGGALRLSIGAQQGKGGKNSSPAAAVVSTPIRDSAGRGRHRLRLDRIWALFRVPEANAQMHEYLRIGSIHVSIGGNGRRLVVETREFALREEFVLPSRPDSRLHLLAIERNPSIGTASSSRSLTVRLDNQRRQLHNVEEIPVHGGTVEILPLLLAKGEQQQNGGCLEELIFHYSPVDEEMSGQTVVGQNHQVDYLPLFREQLLSRSSMFPANTLMGAQNCGIRDSSLWMGNSSSWGRVGEAEDGEGDGQMFGRGSSLSRFSLLITSALIIVIILSLLFYACYAVKRHYRIRNQLQGLRPKVQKNSNHFERSNGDEKRPLKLTLEEEEEAERREKRNSVAKRVELGGTQQLCAQQQTAATLPTSPAGRSCLKNGNARRLEREEPLTIEHLDNSPAPRQLDECLDATPLRSQPMRRTQQQSPLVSSNRTQQPMPMLTENEVNPADGLWSGFTPSPSSATSSASPRSNSSQGGEHMQRPFVRMVAASHPKQQQSPGDDSLAAPIARKDEL